MTAAPLQPTGSLGRVAVLVDFENIGDAELVERIIRICSERGDVISKKAIGDWSNVTKTAQRALAATCAEMVHQVSNGKGKNSSDVRIVIEAMDLLHDPLTPVDTFVFATSDADFAPIVVRLRSAGKRVVVMPGRTPVAEALSQVADEVVNCLASKKANAKKASLSNGQPSKRTSGAGSKDANTKETAVASVKTSKQSSAAGSKGANSKNPASASVKSSKQSPGAGSKGANTKETAVASAKSSKESPGAGSKGANTKETAGANVKTSKQSPGAGSKGANTKKSADASVKSPKQSSGAGSKGANTKKSASASVKSSKQSSGVGSKQVIPDDVRTLILTAIDAFQSETQEASASSNALIQRVRAERPDFSPKDHGYANFKRMFQAFPEVVVQNSARQGQYTVSKK